MKKFTKHLLFTLITVIILTITFVISASAETYSGTCGDNATWSLDTESGVFNITGSGNMNSYGSYSSVPWYSYRSYIKSAIIADNVTNIGNYIFYKCENLTKVNIPDSITDIGIASFAYCSNLASITIPNSVTRIDHFAFEKCTNLKEMYIYDISAWLNVKLSSSNSHPLNSGNSKLYIKNELITELSIPNTVTTIGNYAFYGCCSLTNVIIPEGITSIGDSAFQECSGIVSIKIPDSVTNISQSAFSYCSSLSHIEIPKNVTVINSSLFASCTALTNVIIPDSVTSIGISAFYKCSNLKNITFPDSVINIGSSAFKGCSSLEAATIGNNVSDINSNAFENCTSLSNVILGCSLKNIGDEVFKNCSSLISINIPDSIIEIGDYAFYNCSSLSTVTIPDNTVYIGSHAFEKCTALKTASIGNGTAAIENSTFKDCTALTSIALGDGIKAICYEAFKNCTNLIDIIIPSNTKEIGNDAFNNCISLASITISDKVSSISQFAFYNCTNLKKLYINDLESWLKIELTDSNSNPLNSGSGTLYIKNEVAESITIPNSITIIGDYAFYGCGSLLNITIPDTVTNIGACTFYNCSNLETVKIGNGIKDIGHSAFNNCSSLKNINIPNGVTNIGNFMFEYCSSLTNIIIPDSVTYLGYYAFNGCSNLETVIIGNSVEDILNHTFYNCINLKNVTLGNNIKSIGSYAFTYCSNLISLIIPNSVKTIGNNILRECNSIESLTTPFMPSGNLGYFFGAIYKDDNDFYVPVSLKNVTITNSKNISSYAFFNCKNIVNIALSNRTITIDKSAFYNCTELVNISMGNNVTGIGQEAFQNCKSLKSIMIPDSVTSIHTYAFYGCENLKTIYLYRNSYADSYFSSSQYTKIYLTTKVDTDVLVPSEDDEPEEYKYSFKVMDIEDETPICNASITLGGMSAVTDDKGMASFKTSEEETVTMSVSAEDYIDVEFEGYKIGGKNALEIIGMMKEKEDAILPISCNGTPISTTAAQINNKADLYASIIVKGTSSSKIIGYKLKQGSKLLAESSGGSFTVKNSSFKKNVPVTAYAYTEEGKEISKTLNINVISFDLIDPSFNLSGESVKIPGDIELFGGMEIKFELNEKVDIEFEISNYEIKVGLNMQVAEKDLSKLNGGLRKWMDSHDRKTPSAKAGFKVGGYVLIELGNYGIKDIKADIVLTLEYTNGFCKTYILSVPVRVEVECGVSGKFTITAIGYDFENSKLLYPSLEGTASGSVTASAGIGNWLASAGVYGKLGIEIAMNILPAAG